MAVESIIELVTHKAIYNKISTQLYFIKENSQRIMLVLTSLEAQEVPSACTVYNCLEDLRSYLKSGLSKSSFGVETDRLLAKYPAEQKRKHIKSIQMCIQAVPSETRGALG